MAGSRPKIPVGNPVISTWLRLGMFSPDVGWAVMIHSARPSPTFGRPSTTNVHPLGALPLCTARTLADVDVDPKARPSTHESTQAVKAYSSPSGRPAKVAVAPSGEVSHRWPSRTIP